MVSVNGLPRLCMMNDDRFLMFLDHSGKFVATMDEDGVFAILNPEMDFIPSEGEIFAGEDFMSGPWAGRADGVAEGAEISVLQEKGEKTLREFGPDIESCMEVFGANPGPAITSMRDLLPQARALDPAPPFPDELTGAGNDGTARPTIGTPPGGAVFALECRPHLIALGPLCASLSQTSGVVSFSADILPDELPKMRVRVRLFALASTLCVLESASPDGVRITLV